MQTHQHPFKCTAAVFHLRQYYLQKTVDMYRENTIEYLKALLLSIQDLADLGILYDQ